MPGTGYYWDPRFGWMDAGFPVPPVSPWNAPQAAPWQPHHGWRLSVGLDPNDPGAGWGQAPTEQEKAQGYKKTDVMTLQLKCSQLRAKLEDLLANVDAGATDPGSLAALKTLLANVIALETEVATLAQGSSYSKFSQLTAKYNALAAEFASYGIEEAAPPPAPAKGGGGSGGSPPVVQPPTVVKPAATPSSPVITTKKTENAPAWVLYVGVGVAAVAAFFGLRVLKVF